MYAFKFFPLRSDSLIYIFTDKKQNKIKIDKNATSTEILRLLRDKKRLRWVRNLVTYDLYKLLGKLISETFSRFQILSLL